MLIRISQSLKGFIRWKRLPLFVLGICFVLLCNVYRFPATAQSTDLDVTEATVSEIAQGNQVFIQNRQANLGEIAKTSQQVRTGESIAQLRFNNWAIARLGKNTALTIGQCGAYVQQGDVLLNGPVSACTAHVTAAVSGTTYIMEVDSKGGENVEVLEGEVEVTSNWNGQTNKVIVKSGEGFESSASNPLGTVQPFNRQEFDEFLTGDLLNNYRSSLPSSSVDRIETTYKRRFPNTKFPLKRTDLKPHRGHFSLAILQNQPTLSQAIARVSLLAKRSNGFLPEHFVGDFLYPINGSAQFIRGLNPSDRVVVRLFDPKTSQFIGYSEFELLDDNAAVNLVLPNRAQDFGTVRTVMGIDADRNGAIDTFEPVFDYFTRVNYPDSNDFSKAEVYFLDNPDNIDFRSYNPKGLPYPVRKPAYTRSFVAGDYKRLNRSWSVFPNDLEELLLANPYQKVQPVAINLDGSSFYDVPVEILKYRRRS
ncbi:hypothetical protein V2H45_02200 [Tumidithrix elongata RA019]|uniref:FecR protein domain-containing protein n=1 Tax=Tumidithrix elongata BACA0141 TaxID=2716417 RepID=A0AAW9PQ18_9CYAN|nr:hypothetical protein [Tumidithrix elongata RA019]